MNDPQAKEVLHSLNNLAGNGEGFFLADFTIFYYIFKQVSMRAVFSNEIAVSRSPIDILKTDNIRMVKRLQNLYLALQQSNARRRVLF